MLFLVSSNPGFYTPEHWKQETQFAIYINNSYYASTCKSNRYTMQFAKKHPTTLGYLALIFWALGALFTIKIKSLPLFQSLTIIFTISFLISATKLTISREWNKLKQPWFLWLIGFSGIYGNDIFYLASFQYAPAVQADLINHLWPISVILLTGFLPNEKITTSHFVAALIGFIGIYILLVDGDNKFEYQYMNGYVLALFNVAVWTAYTLAARHHRNTPVETVGIYCGLGAVCSFIIHIKTETFVLPHLDQWEVLLIMGITTQGLAYYFWDYAVKQGNFKLLTLLSYSSPVLSVMILVWFGKAEPSLRLLIASILVSGAGIIGTTNWRTIFNKFSSSAVNVSQTSKIN